MEEWKMLAGLAALVSSLKAPSYREGLARMVGLSMALKYNTVRCCSLTGPTSSNYMRNVNRDPNRDFTGRRHWLNFMFCIKTKWSLIIHLTTHLVHWLFPLGFLFLWYSISSTVHTAPFTFSTRLKHLWRLRLCRTAFWNKMSLMRVQDSVFLIDSSLRMRY